MFNRKPKPAQPQPMTPIDRNTYLRETTSIIDQLLQAQPGHIGDYPQAETWIKDSLEHLRETIAAIDFNNLTAAEETQLASLLTNDLTKIFNRVVFDNNNKNLSWVGLSDRISHKTNRIRKTILKLCLTQQTRARGQAINIDTTLWQQQPITNDTNATPARITFPAFTTPDTNLQTAYNNLRDTWAQASFKNLGVEAAYIVSAVATDYLPDSIRIYQRLTQRSPQAASQGASMLTEQLNMMRNQLETVLSHETADALAEMHAQSRFLAGKTQPITDTP